MEYTEEQKAQIRTLFATRRRRQLLVSLPLVAMIVGFVFLENGKAGTILGFPASMILPGFLAVMGGAILFSLHNWRCPGCNKYLGKQRSPKFCSKCGVALQ